MITAVDILLSVSKMIETAVAKPVFPDFPVFQERLKIWIFKRKKFLFERLVNHSNFLNTAIQPKDEVLKLHSSIQVKKQFKI